MINILIIEDNQEINHMIQTYLTARDCVCTQCYSGTEGLLRAEMHQYDAIILDLMIPGISGEECIPKLKALQSIPIIVISAKDSLASKVNVLQTGADDYLCKPFDLEELYVRIQVLLRHQMKATSLTYDDLKLNQDQFCLEIHNQKISLTKHEYAILELLLTYPNKVHTKAEIYEYAWQESYYGDDKTINTHMSNIRSKLRNLNDKEYVQTVWGIGFKIKTE